MCAARLSSGVVRELLGLPLGRRRFFVALVGRTSTLLERSWSLLGRSWGHLGGSWIHLGLSWGRLGALGAILGDLEAILGLSGGVLGALGAILDAIDDDKMFLAIPSSEKGPDPHTQTDFGVRPKRPS